MTPGFASGRELQEDILQRMRRLRIWRQRRRKRALAQSDIPGGGCGSDPGGNLHTRERFPCTACEVQREIHAEHAAGFDLNAACSGFLFALQTAQAYIQAGIYRTVLVIGVDSMSHMVDWSDRSTCILFGDGGRSCGASRIEGRSVCAGCAFGRRKRRCSDRMQPAQKKW